MKNILNKTAGNPLILGLIIFSIVPMSLGWSFIATLSILTMMTIVAFLLNKGFHKFDLIYVAIAYLLLLGYLFPDFINLGS